MDGFTFASVDMAPDLDEYANTLALIAQTSRQLVKLRARISATDSDYRVIVRVAYDTMVRKAARADRS